ncbi:ABC transporter substrate-binding protein [Sedimentitalea nanhaiensis]|uniref:Peptide/nickel transport system substrate-binding protein n=1 Tax=Sedimentitalea nanhaiensis TaxID=999627 RepID=A0A1I7CSK3_9RHOB|nr:ABC transporter substrate-binding protein [Sedimentitalea nanhaiensis]SFU02427.1 peptide/nickel transport system substrate-binding protein [Sedimentitalea nanhaiensis]
MKISRRHLLAWPLAIATALAIGTSAQAAPPKDTFVMAKDISDIITLDPAEVFEFSGGEMIANIYDKLMMFEPENLTKLVGGVAESWDISEDGKTIAFAIRPDMTFHSGNPVTAEDVVYSLRRVVKLGKTPSFIITQFGWTPENVDELIVVDGDKAKITITEEFSPALVLNALSAGIASIVDMKEVMAHEVDGDMGYGWLKNNSAGSGPFMLKSWKANELVSLEAFPDYRHGAPGVKRVIIRHIAEPSAQRLMIEKGDVDLARDLTPDQIEGISSNEDLKIQADPKGALIYLAANASDPILGNPKVVEALRYLVDYQGMANSFLQGQFKVHQAAWPGGLWGAYDETPFTLDVEKAKALLAEAGYPDGFEIKIDTLNSSPYPQIAQSVQATLAQAGIRASITTAEGKTLWPMYRAQKHQLILAQWSPDYTDPHSNLDAFAHNPDNRPEAKLTGVLAWRNAWADEATNAKVVAARNELDLDKREALYQEIQHDLQMNSPYAILFQQTEQSAIRKEVEGYVSGATFDMIYYRGITK